MAKIWPALDLVTSSTSLAAFLVLDISRIIDGYIVIPCAAAEIWMVLYLLIIGVRKLDRSGSLSVPLEQVQRSSTEGMSPQQSFTKFFFAVVGPIATHRRRRRATLQLVALSDRQLDEFGLSRQAIIEDASGRY